MVNYLPLGAESADLDELFGALSSSPRRTIIERLADGRRAAVGEIANEFLISLPAISRHLTVLERCGMLKRETQGRIHYISLDVRGLDASAHWIETTRGFWEARFDALSLLMSQRSNERARTRGAP